MLIDQVGAIFSSHQRLSTPKKIAVETQNDNLLFRGPAENAMGVLRQCNITYTAVRWPPKMNSTVRHLNPFAT